MADAAPNFERVEQRIRDAATFDELCAALR